MNTNNKIFITAILSLSIFFQACKKEAEISKPVIIMTELGLNNSKTAYAGGEFHMDAEVEAAGKIKTIAIEIHPEEDHESKSVQFWLGASGWEADTVYTNFEGLKNTSFHEHLEIPAEASAGHYHFHFVVTDMEGNQSTYEDEIEILKPNDNQAPVLIVSQAPDAGQVFSQGQTIQVSGSLTDDLALGGIYVALVRVDQQLQDTLVNSANTITLLHFHDFDGETNYTFNASIVTGAAQDNNDPPKAVSGNITWQSGAYYLLVKAFDAIGSNEVYSQHYPVTINLNSK